MTGFLRTKKALDAAALSALGLLVCVGAVAQETKWVQLSEQVQQLHAQGRNGEAMPLAIEAVRTARATWGAQDLHVGLSLNVIGVLDEDSEKFADAESNLQQALAIMTKVPGAEKNAATVLDNLGNLYRMEGKYADAEKAVQQALTIHEKIAGPNDSNVSTDATNLGAIYEAEGKYADAIPLYQRAIAIEERLQSSDLAVVLNGLGQVYTDVNKYAEAEAIFARALELDLKAFGNSHPHIAVDLGNLGTAFMGEGKFAQAEPIFSRALQIAEDANPPDQDTVAHVLGNMGALAIEEGKYGVAEKFLTQELTERTKTLGADHPNIAPILDNLGKLFKYEMRYGDAEQAFKQSLAIRVKKLGSQHPLVGLSMFNLAMLYGGYGRWGAAEQMYHDAIPIYMKAYGQTDVRTADMIYEGALLLLEEGKFEQAATGFAGAAAIYRTVKGENSGEYAKCLGAMAEMNEDAGKHADAEMLYKHAIEIAEKAWGTSDTRVADELIGLAQVYKNEQKFADAEPLALRAVKIDEAKLARNAPALGETYLNLAVLYYAWGKPQQATPYFDKRIGSLMGEFEANASTMSERDRLIYFATTPGAFPLYFSFVLKHHAQIPELTGKMYDALLQERGFIAEHAAAMRAAVEGSGDKDAAAMLVRLADEKTQLAALTESTTGDPANRRDQIAKLQQDSNSLEQEIAKRSAAYQQQNTLHAATWRDVQKALKPGEAAVEVTRFQLHTGMTFAANIVYVALVVTPDSRNPLLVPLGEAKDLEAGPLLAYRAEVGQTRGFQAEQASGTTGEPANAASTGGAYAAFWKPLEPALGNAKRVYFTPDGVLNTIPIGLLADGGGKLVMEKYDLRIVNSTKDLLRSSRLAQAKSALLVGNPKFDLSANDQRTALAQANGGPHPSTPAQQQQIAELGSQRGGELAGPSLNPLPGTQVEVNAIEKQLTDAGWKVDSYTGDKALKTEVTNAHGPRVVHIATHGFFLSDQELAAKAKSQGQSPVTGQDPMLRSGLFFAGADRLRAGTPQEAGLDDGVLTAFEASQLNLRGTELVVLSACETGLGAQSNSEGVFGLRRGLQEAGADAVMMSMWSVPDKETQELMALFYKNWLGGMEKPEALHKAQLEEREVVRQRYGKDLPYYWGAFVMISR